MLKDSNETFLFKLLGLISLAGFLSINNEYYIDNIGSGYIDGATSFFFKLDFGRKIKIGPIFGVFLRTNFISGFNSGLNFQYEFTKNILFVKGDMMTEILGPYNNPQGSGYAFTDKTRRFWIRFGIKRKLLRNK